MDQTITAQMAAFNQMHKEIDLVYHQYARKIGLSDTALWLLICIAEHEDAVTQRDLCAEWFFAPQTLNSALHNLQKHGLLVLESTPDNRKNKRIRLSDAGICFVQRSILPLMQAESAAFSALQAQDRAFLLSSTQKHIDLLKAQISHLTEEHV